jgi:hypothetical protein
MIVADVQPPHKEALMSQAISTHHPAVVLRSRYQQLRALLAVAMIAVVGLTAAVVVLAIDDGGTAAPAQAVRTSAPSSTVASRSDGGPEESAVAASLTRPAATPGPDESVVARAVAGH